MNIEYDVIPADPALFASYENILVPALYSATDEVLNALNEFVANGGNMVVTFKSAFSDEHLKIRHDVQPYIINKSLGIQYDEFTLPDDVTVTCGGKSSKARDWMEMVDCTLPHLLLCMSTSTGEYTLLSPKTAMVRAVPCILPHLLVRTR